MVMKATDFGFIVPQMNCEYLSDIIVEVALRRNRYLCPLAVTSGCWLEVITEMILSRVSSFIESATAENQPPTIRSTLSCSIARLAALTPSSGVPLSS